MSKTSHKAFFGDAEHTFDLGKPEIVRELETVTGVGIGALCDRVLDSRQFAHADLEHTIRLGLVGGGMNPKVAAGLVANYLPHHPLVELQLVAFGVLGALWFGNPEPAPAPAPFEEAVS